MGVWMLVWQLKPLRPRRLCWHLDLEPAAMGWRKAEVIFRLPASSRDRCPPTRKRTFPLTLEWGLDLTGWVQAGSPTLFDLGAQCKSPRTK